MTSSDYMFSICSPETPRASISNTLHQTAFTLNLGKETMMFCPIISKLFNWGQTHKSSWLAAETFKNQMQILTNSVENYCNKAINTCFKIEQTCSIRDTDTLHALLVIDTSLSQQVVSTTVQKQLLNFSMSLLINGHHSLTWSPSAIITRHARSKVNQCSCFAASTTKHEAISTILSNSTYRLSHPT